MTPVSTPFPIHPSNRRKCPSAPELRAISHRSSDHKGAVTRSPPDLPYPALADPQPPPSRTRVLPRFPANSNDFTIEATSSAGANDKCGLTSLRNTSSTDLTNKHQDTGTYILRAAQFVLTLPPSIVTAPTTLHTLNQVHNRSPYSLIRSANEPQAASPPTIARPKPSTTSGHQATSP
jgi:hypothetical protein